MNTRSLTIRRIEDLENATGRNREFRPVQLGSIDVRGQLNIAEFGGLSLTHGRFNSDMHVSGTYSNEKLSLGVLLKADDIQCFGKEAQTGDLVVVGKAKETEGRYRSELEYVVINVDKSDVLRLAEAEGRVISPDLLEGGDLYRLNQRVGIRLAKRMNTVAKKLREPLLQTLAPAAGQLLAEEIIRWFALCISNIQGKTEEKPYRGLPKLVRRAEEWLEADALRVPRIQELATGLHVSERQLYRAFHSEVGMSPAKYLRRYRLTRARFDLLSANPPETTVTSVASSLGFWELGRFSVEYRRLFGESPSQTLSTMR